MEHRNTELELDFPSIQAITIGTYTHTLYVYIHITMLRVYVESHVATHHSRLSYTFSISVAFHLFFGFRPFSEAHWIQLIWKRFPPHLQNIWETNCLLVSVFGKEFIHWLEWE